MKISAAVAAVVAAGLIATDKKPEDVTAALVAAYALDKKAKDEAEEKDEADCAAAAKDAGCEPKDMVKGKDGKWAKDKKAKDTAGNDLPAGEEAIDEGVNAPLETPKTSPGLDAKAMDAAISTAVTAALASERVKSEALFAARKDVEKVLGIVAYDSAEQVYGAALTHLGVDHKGVHPSALRAVFHASVKAAPAAGTVAHDAATVQTMDQAFPGFDRMRNR